MDIELCRCSELILSATVWNKEPRSNNWASQKIDDITETT